MIKLFQIENHDYPFECLWRKSFPMRYSGYVDLKNGRVVDCFELKRIYGLSNFSTAKEYFERYEVYKMVVFDFFKEAMTVETETGRLILCGDRQNPIKVWLPKKLIKVSDSERPDMYTVKMPLWLFSRTPLCNYTDWSVGNA
jgi:hypothetical protein